MSKEKYTTRVIKSMIGKIGYMENYCYNAFMGEDEYFELALCLTYLTMSKEKIIKKDKHNNDRMARLSKKVDQAEIDKVFAPGFASKMPKIIQATEYNNLWILDAIRDALMHCQFDIDDDNRVFKLNNTYYDRNLIAEIPYEWIIAYAKNDILKKRCMSKYTVNGFYYNPKLKDGKSFNTKNEIHHNIMYRATIVGDNGLEFNVKHVESRVRELFEKYAEEEVILDEYKNYKPRMYNHIKYFDPMYLTSFLKAKDKVIEKIQEEFPGLTIKIIIDNRKHKLINKIDKGLLRNYRNYNVLYKSLNEVISPKGITLLEQISSIIAELGNIDEERIITPEENNEYFNQLLNQYNEEDTWSIRATREKNIRKLREIMLTVMGVSTVVLNHDDIFVNYYEHHSSSDAYAIVSNKDSTEKFGNEFKSTLKKLLVTESKLDEKLEQYNNCKTEAAKQNVKKYVDQYEAELELANAEINRLVGNFRAFELASTERKKVNNLIEARGFVKWLQLKYKEFKLTPPHKNGRDSIIKEILQGVEDRKLVEMEKRFGYTEDPKEWLLILRNCLSHIGRITVGSNFGMSTSITLNDYDNYDKRSGIIFVKYGHLLDILTNPYMNILYKEEQEIVEEQVKKLTP